MDTFFKKLKGDSVMFILILVFGYIGIKYLILKYKNKVDEKSSAEVQTDVTTNKQNIHAKQNNLHLTCCLVSRNTKIVLAILCCLEVILVALIQCYSEKLFDSCMDYGPPTVIDSRLNFVGYEEYQDVFSLYSPNEVYLVENKPGELIQFKGYDIDMLDQLYAQERDRLTLLICRTTCPTLTDSQAEQSQDLSNRYENKICNYVEEVEYCRKQLEIAPSRAYFKRMANAALEHAKELPLNSDYYAEIERYTRISITSYFHYLQYENPNENILSISDALYRIAQGYSLQAELIDRIKPKNAEDKRLTALANSAIFYTLSCLYSRDDDIYVKSNIYYSALTYHEIAIFLSQGYNNNVYYFLKRAEDIYLQAICCYEEENNIMLAKTYEDLSYLYSIMEINCRYFETGDNRDFFALSNEYEKKAIEIYS